MESAVGMKSPRSAVSVQMKLLASIFWGSIPFEAGLLQDIDWHLWQVEAYTSIKARSEWPGAPASEVSLQRMLE